MNHDTCAFASSIYQRASVKRRAERAGRPVIWQVAASRSAYKTLDKRSALYKDKR